MIAGRSRLKGLFQKYSNFKFLKSLADVGTRGQPLGNLETLSRVTSISFAWKVDLQKCIDATPTVVETTPTVVETSPTSTNVFVGSHSGYFVCVGLDSGNEVWRIRLPDRIESAAAVSSCKKFIFVGERTIEILTNLTLFLHLESNPLTNFF